MGIHLGVNFYKVGKISLYVFSFFCFELSTWIDMAIKTNFMVALIHVHV